MFSCVTRSQTTCIRARVRAHVTDITYTLAKVLRDVPLVCQGRLCTRIKGIS